MINKYLLVFIVFIILILFLFISNNLNLKLEKFRDISIQQCFMLEPAETKHMNINECIEKCNISCKDIEKCQEICVNCNIGENWNEDEKNKRCPWLKDIKIQHKSVPHAPKIRVFPGESKLLLEWKKPFDGNLPITNYIIVISETFNKNKGLKLNVSSNPECQICEQEVGNLKGQVYYDVFLVAVNNKGFSEKSNIETIVTMGKNRQDIIKNIFMEEEELDNELSNKFINQPCDNKGFVNNENYSLDGYKNIDLISSIKKLKTNS
jgi:hypothetical protein